MQQGRAPGDASARAEKRGALRRGMQQEGQVSLQPFIACRSGAAEDVEIVKFDSPAIAFLDDRHDPMTAFFERQQFLALVGAEFCSRQAHRVPEQEFAYDEAEEDKSP